MEAYRLARTRGICLCTCNIFDLGAQVEFFLHFVWLHRSLVLRVLMLAASLLQGKSVSLTNFFRIARNTMTMCFNKEPGAAEVEVSMFMLKETKRDVTPVVFMWLITLRCLSCSKSTGGSWSSETPTWLCIVGRWTPVHMAVVSPQESQSHFQSK